MDNEIKSEINFLSSGQHTVADKKTMFIGSVTKMIYDHTIFKNNKDLHKYIIIFENHFKKSVNGFDGYKDYLFKSRTLLASRICRMIFEETDSISTTKLIQSHILFIKNEKKSLQNKAKKKKSKTNGSLLDDFIKREDF